MERGCTVQIAKLCRESEAGVDGARGARGRGDVAAPVPSTWVRSEQGSAGLHTPIGVGLGAPAFVF